MNGRARSNPVRLTLGVVLFVVVALAALIGLRPVTARGSAAAVASAARSMELASLRAWAPGPIEPVAVKASEVPARRADARSPDPRTSASRRRRDPHRPRDPAERHHRPSHARPSGLARPRAPSPLARPTLLLILRRAPVRAHASSAPW
ncbi:MAG: hypothetical protein IPJ34_26605 [Myxococcales bacterium]|nr:hypothetical protein [Myxococcales bacterium]